MHRLHVFGAYMLDCVPDRAYFHAMVLNPVHGQAVAAAASVAAVAAAAVDAATGGWRLRAVGCLRMLIKRIYIASSMHGFLIQRHSE